MTKTLDKTRWVRPGYFFTSIDCISAYFAILLEKSEAMYIWFRWRGTLYEFLCIMC